MKTTPLRPHALLALLAVCALACPAAPLELTTTTFAGSDQTPSPACLSAAPDGVVYVGVDLAGSLGKGPGKGRIMRLVDTDHDGKADESGVFVEVDNPRGLMAVGDQLYVLHTVIPRDTGVMSGMHLGVFTDADHDGKADGPEKILIKNISSLKPNQQRGADHTSNGIRMGIDGWIYCAIGDFGFVDAEGADGAKLTQLGGGILRVRPDGTEMEVYTHGLRNIYDVAIDPFMNIFTRGNSNDGGGWNIRFIHQIQTGEYGYPVLFKYFTDEIIPALVDLGGGSGTGSLYFQEPGWPAEYNHVPMMGDWGQSHLFIHRLTADGPSFTQAAEKFLACNQITDVDVDGSGRLYLASWAGAGYSGNPNRGAVQRVVPADWNFTPFPKLTELADAALVELLKRPSATTRLHAQQEVLRRGRAAAGTALLAVMNDAGVAAESRVAALFTYAQLLGAQARPGLLAAARDGALREFALRALADRKPLAPDLPLQPFLDGLRDASPRVQVVSAVALGRIGRPEVAQALLAVATPPVQEDPGVVAARIFTSAVVSSQETAVIDVDITGCKKLYLTIDDAGNGNGHDHGAWCEPVLVDAQGHHTPLTQLTWASASQGWGQTLVNRSCVGTPLVRADGTAVTQGIGSHARSVIVYDLPHAYVRFQATGGIANSAAVGHGSVTFSVSSAPLGPVAVAGPEGPHATPNPAIIVPHVAVHALVQLHAVDACLAALDGPSPDGALWALRLMHDPRAVAGLIRKLEATPTGALRLKLLTALARLYQKEAPYDGSWWWSTQPDTRGPYYVPVTWEASAQIEKAYRAAYDQAGPKVKNMLADIASKHRMNLSGIGKVEVPAETPSGTQGEVGRAAVEDVLVALGNLKGDPARGRQLLGGLACIACHNLNPGDAIKGPDLLHVGARLSRTEIAESILRPDATISASWVKVTLNDGSGVQGTLVSKTATDVVVHNIAGIATALKVADIKSIATENSTLMPPALASPLSFQQFADLVDYLHALK